MGLNDELEEARKAVEDLMERALNESWRRQKADEEMAASLQKVTSCPENGSGPIKNFSAQDIQTCIF